MTSSPIHDDQCIDWCNHCSACGRGILFGSLCREHQRRCDCEHYTGESEGRCKQCGGRTSASVQPGSEPK